MMEKKNFPLYARVQFINCKESGQKGTILGKSIIDIIDHYIVLMDKNSYQADGSEAAAFAIPEHCLEQIDDVEVGGVCWYTVEDLDFISKAKDMVGG